MIMFLCAALAALAVLLFGKRCSWRLLKIWLAVCVLLFAVLTVIEIGFGLITGNGVDDSVFFHMTTGLEGGDVSQYTMPIVVGAVVILLFGVLPAALTLRLSPGRTQRSFVWNGVTAVLALAALLLHPATTATASYALRFSLAEQRQDGFVVPVARPDETVARKNLVLIYLESVERTYFDEERFPALVQRLRALESRATTFTDVSQTIGAGFTIGGMVASQCGTPLILSGGENSMRVSRFLAGATCLGDLLQDAGYELSYLGGAPLEFAGKGAFYKTHGYDTVQGYDELAPIQDTPDYRAEWGLQDDALFDLARRRMAELARGDKPFALTMLTLDTHHPNGHGDTNKTCRDLKYRDGKNPILNSVVCADTLAAQFVEDILAGPEGKNTVVAVMSDHLAMGNSASGQLEAGPRRNLFLLIDPEDAVGATVDRPATTLDIGPTILTRLGLGVDRMGFGVDLLGEAPTLPEELKVSSDNRAALDRHLLGYRAIYDRLWDFPGLADGLYANLERGEIQLGESAFKAPVLLAIDDALKIAQATLGEVNAEATLTEGVRDLPEGTRYLWIDDCRALDLLREAPSKGPSEGLCAAYGRRGSGPGVHAFGRSGFLSSETLSGWLSGDAAPDLAATENARIEEIGQLRGEIAVPLGLPGIGQDGRGVLLHSAAFGAGASLVRRQTTDSLEAGEDWTLRRGINLVGIDAGGRAEILETVDPCAGEGQPGEVRSFGNLIAEGRDRFTAHAIVVHDSAHCGEPGPAVATAIGDMPLPRLQALGMRQPYIAVIDREGRVFEFAGEQFPKLRVYLDPGFRDDRPSGRMGEDKAAPPVVAAAPAASAPEAPAVVVSGDETCIAPGPATPRSSAARTLAQGEMVAGADLDAVVTFGQGWWGAETAGRWSGATAAELTLTLPQADNGDDYLTLDLVAFGGQARPLRILSGETVLASAVIDGRAAAAIPVAGLARGSAIPLRLEVSGEALDCPAGLSGSTDPRQLSLMLVGVRLGAGTGDDRSPVRVVAPSPQRDSRRSAFLTGAVAHGGGRLTGAAITDSFDALQANLDRFDLFEIDLNWTSDGELVCLHDWEESFVSRFGAPVDAPISLAEFRDLLARTPDRPRNCDLEGLAGWMRAHPAKRIVTDVKSEPMRALALIAGRHPDLLGRFVPQAYQPEEIDALRDLGFEDVIWTLYRYGGDAKKVIAEARARHPSALTMPAEMASSGVMAEVAQATGIPLFAHTVNDPATVSCLLAAGAAGVYSDDLGIRDVDALRGSGMSCGGVMMQ